MFQLIMAQAATLPTDPSASNIFDNIWQAVSAHNLSLVIVLITAAVVWLAEHYGPKVWATLGKPVPSALLALVMSVLVALVNAGSSISLSLVLSALAAGFTAWGGPAKLISLFTSSDAPSP